MFFLQEFMAEINSAEPQKYYRNKALDGFRGIGCILVLLGHTQWKGSTILPGAVISMDLFFVLSGFLITGLLLSEFEKTSQIDLFKFWTRRAVRLLPAFYVYFSIGTIAYLVSKFQPIVGTNEYVTLISTGLYASNWAVAKGYELGIFTATWSLSLEEQFYFLCPLFYLFSLKYFNRKIIIFLLVFAIVGINIYRYQLFHQLVIEKGFALAWKRCFYALDTRADSLMIGCLFSILYSQYGHKIKINSYLIFFAVFVYFGSVLIRDLPIAFHIPESSFFSEFLMGGGFSFYSIMGAIIIIYLVQFRESYLSKILSSHFFVQIGIMSYSIYLWHTTIFGGLDIALRALNQSPFLWCIKVLIRFSVVMLVGYLSYRFIELPLLKSLGQKRKYNSLPSNSSNLNG